MTDRDIKLEADPIELARLYIAACERTGDADSKLATVARAVLALAKERDDLRETVEMAHVTLTTLDQPAVYWSEDLGRDMPMSLCHRITSHDEEITSLITEARAERDAWYANFEEQKAAAQTLRSQLATVTAERNAALREADRWRHGVPVEGDYVCPTSQECDDLRAKLVTVRAALAESLNRWEWFAQRFRDRIGGLEAADEYDLPRIAELRRIAEDES